MTAADQNPTPDKPCAGLAAGTLSIVLAYAAFASLWILTSDKLVEWLFDDPSAITLASTLKGGLFVLVTSLLLYGLLHRLARTGMQAPVVAKLPRPGLPFLLLAAAIVAVTALNIMHTINDHRAREVARLQVIADLKARQIADWLRERDGDAEFVRGSRVYAEQFHHWQAGDTSGRDQLLGRLLDWRRNQGYAAVLLFDPNGARVWGSARASAQIAPVLREAINQAGKDYRVHRVGPYRGLAGTLRLDYVVPLVAAGARAPFLVLQTTLGDWILPTLQSWPVTSASGESLLFRRDGDQVQFLNELRHRKDAAGTLRVPLARKDMLSAQVLNGANHPGHALDGVDYRGVPALGVVQPVSGSDWYLIAKLDRAELYAGAIRDSIWIGLSGLLALFMAAAGAYLLGQRQQLAVAAQVQLAQDERLRALRLLAAIADSSNDAIFAKDLAGRYILFNRAACEFVGKAMDEVLGCDDHALFPTEQADQLADIGRRVIAENRILSHEEVLATQDGERVFHATKGPLRDATGMVIGSFGISHDITQQKAAEARLNRLVADQAATLQAIPDLLFELDETGRYLDIKATQDGLLAAPREQLIGHTVQEMLPAAAADTVMAALDAAARAGTDYGRTITLPLPDGARHFELSVACKAGPEGRPLSFVVLSRDITARKEGEAELQRQAEELRVRNDELERFNRATIGRELDMIELKKQVNELCRQVGREPPYSLAFLEEPDA